MYIACCFLAIIFKNHPKQKVLSLKLLSYVKHRTPIYPGQTKSLFFLVYHLNYSYDLMRTVLRDSAITVINVFILSDSHPLSTLSTYYLTIQEQSI